MSDPTKLPPPDLAPGDVYVHALGNGAVFVLHDDGRSGLVPLAEAVSAVEGCHARGCRTLIGRDAGPLADDAVRALTATGVPLELVDAPSPQAWEHGTTALMEAAAHGNDRLLDDLAGRGATLHDRDVSGSTALHHAAAHGNLHAIDVLVAAGLDPDHRNAEGFTPYRLATAARQLPAAQRLADLGADTSAGAEEAVSFHPGHRAVLWAWVLVPAIQLAAAVVLAITVHPIVGIAVAVAAVAFARWLAPPPAARAGGAPRRLEGTTLTVRGLGPARDVDLRPVTVAAIAGATGRHARLGSRWLLLDHPDGSPADREVLRRLAVPADELDALAGRMDRVLVVPIAGGRHEEVILPVGSALSGLGVDLSRSLRAQLAAARERQR